MTDDTLSDRAATYWLFVFLLTAGAIGGLVIEAFGGWLLAPMVVGSVVLAGVGFALEEYAPEVFEEPEPVEEVETVE